jgi:ABC-type sugar transport system ATPase subunit
MNFMNVEIHRENGDYHAQGEGIDALVSAERGTAASGRGRVVLGIRPEDVSIVPADQGEGIPGEVYVVEPVGRDDLVEIIIGKAKVHALADREKNYNIGDQVRLKFDAEKVHFFDPETEKSLLWK